MRTRPARAAWAKLQPKESFMTVVPATSKTMAASKQSQ